MSRPSYDAFFSTATKGQTTASDGQQAYDYQCRLACGERSHRGEADWLTGGTNGASRLINIPTGLGETATK